MTAPAQREGGALRIGLWSGDEKLHALAFGEEAWTGAIFQLSSGVGSQVGRGVLFTAAACLKKFTPIRL
jgi:hypothetical protein